MFKKQIESILYQGLLRSTWLKQKARRTFLKATNKLIDPIYLDIGAGKNSEAFRWTSIDYAEGTIIQENTKLTFNDAQLEFVYCSMFFEHINDETASNLLKEVARCIKKGKSLRIVVPDFHKYFEKYRNGDKEFFMKFTNSRQNTDTWHLYDIPVDIEHLFVSAISSLHNLPHKLVDFPWQERLNQNPPEAYYPHQNKLKGYYCGPAPEMTTEAIKENFHNLSESDFLDWVFKMTSASKCSEKLFNKWHKNSWDLDKLTKFATKAGFSKCESSEFSPNYGKREKPGHQKIGLYFNLYK